MSSRRPPDTRPPMQIALSGQRVTGPGNGTYSPSVAKEWPAEEFRDYLAAHMKEQGIPDYAELSRRSGVGQWQLSQYHRGMAQPSVKSLRKLAPALNAPLVKLMLVAGHNDAAELELDDDLDLRVIPAEFRDLLALWDDSRLTKDQRSFVRRSIATLVAGLRSELPVQGRDSKDRPSGGRRTA